MDRPSGLLIATILAALVFALPVEACSCLDPGEPLLALAHSDAVFVGVVRDLRRRPDILADIAVYFDVLSSWKGMQRDTAVVLTSSQGSMCGYGFERGAVYLVYATGKDSTLGTSKCSRTQLADKPNVDLVALGNPAYKRRSKPPRTPPRPAFCPLHSTMALEPTYWSDVDTTVVSPPAGYLEAREKAFLFSNRWILRGKHRDASIVESFYYCPMCRYNESNWCKDHGGCFGWKPAEPLRLY